MDILLDVGIHREVTAMSNVILSLRDLRIYYIVKGGFLNLKKNYVKAVDGINIDIFEGEAFGIVGESGCGKSTTGYGIVGLLKPTEGEILFEGLDISKKSTRGIEFASKVQIIFQDPYSSLDPRFTVGRSIAEPLVVHKIGNSKSQRERVLKLMNDVGLHEEQYTKFPHEFSGGQRQRIGIARAMALDPKLIVCDEPVSALDVSIQAQILNLMQELQKKYNLTYVFISHNLSVVEHICDRIAVMYLGNVIEIAKKRELFDNPKHPYTQALLDAIPIPDPTMKKMQNVLSGDVPSPFNPPSGCCFHTRCPKAAEKCSTIKPGKTEVADGHFVCCHYI